MRSSQVSRPFWLRFDRECFHSRRVKFQKRMELLCVPCKPVVVEVAAQNLVERADLVFYGLMSHPAEALPHPGSCPAEALPIRLEHRLDDSLAEAPGSVNREAKERQPPPLMGLMVSPGTQVRLVGLLVGKCEPELRQTRL